MSEPAYSTCTPCSVEVISFGYGHGVPAQAHATFDVRAHFKDPHVNPALRHLTAASTAVMDAVLNTPGVPQLAESIAGVVRAFRAGPVVHPVVIAVGCVGGRHRSAAIAIVVARAVQRDGVQVTVTHRDLHRPVLARK